MSSIADPPVTVPSYSPNPSGLALLAIRGLGLSGLARVIAAGSPNGLPPGGLVDFSNSIERLLRATNGLGITVDGYLNGAPVSRAGLVEHLAVVRLAYLTMAQTLAELAGAFASDGSAIVELAPIETGTYPALTRVL